MLQYMWIGSSKRLQTFSEATNWEQKEEEKEEEEDNTVSSPEIRMFHLC
jgi:hypothetical protein